MSAHYAQTRVSLLTGSISRRAKGVAGRPPKANLRWWAMPSSRAVRRAWRTITSGAKRSVKIRLTHRTASQRKRCARIRNWTGDRPAADPPRVGDSGYVHARKLCRTKGIVLIGERD
jgi:hypothetical protein